MNDQNGYCRTLKQQYANTAIQNLQSKGTFGATGVVQFIAFRILRQLLLL